MKTRNKIIIIFMSLGVILVPTVMVLKYYFTTVYRPEPFFFRYTDDFDNVWEYFETYQRKTNKESWPSPDLLAQDSNTVALCAEQPFKDYGIWVFESKAGYGKYLYTPNVFEKHVKYDEDGYYNGVIIMCNMAKWEEPKGYYHSYDKLSKDIINAMGGEYWAYMSFFGPHGSLKSMLPPIPGAILLKENYTSGIEKVYYPKDILPALKAIYPNLEVPKEAILD